MNFILSCLAYLFIAGLIGWGILRAVHGEPMLLIIAFLAYAVAFAKIGCLPKQTH